MQNRLPKDNFFEKMRSLGLSLTFDDVRLKTGYSRVMPDDIDLETRFSRNTPLKIPIVSAAMDTVTEAELAIELAKLGGIGVIHKNLTPEEQASQVGKVKCHLNGLIKKPICFKENDSVKYMLERKEEKGYTFHSFPIINNDSVLVGIITKDDFDFCENDNLRAKDIMTKKLVTAGKDTAIKKAYKMMYEHRKKILPLIDEHNHIVGLYTLTDLKRILAKGQEGYNVDKNGQLRVAAAIGVYDDAFERLERLTKENLDVAVIDTAHGDSKPVIETLKKIKRKYSSLDVVVGNVSEPRSVIRLIKAGADGVKIGQGGGSICTTRIIAGIGAPQVTAVYECSKVARDADIPICADGGIRYTGDITIALGTGAHSVMLGNLLAGTKESPGRIEFIDGRQWKSYRGMGSIGAMETSKGSRERYGQRKTGKGQLIAEGIEGLVPYKGELKDVIYQYTGGLRRGMGYVGVANLKELREKADFRRMTNAGQAESHPHDVQITMEAPNYTAK